MCALFVGRPAEDILDRIDQTYELIMLRKSLEIPVATGYGPLSGGPEVPYSYINYVRWYKEQEDATRQQAT